jgi:LmbE family N-acetylglucosaminyl deacetylase
MFQLSIKDNLNKVRRWLIGVAIRYLAQPAEVSADSLLVIAPHPDDETFACGGVILQKKAMNANVSVIFFTDGEASHRNCCSVSLHEVRQIRRQLAVKAGNLLGLKPEDMFWLGLPDGRIPKNGDDAFNPAIEKLAELFLTIKPDEIYAPHFLDCWPDHEAANEIVLSVLKNYLHPYELYYYPVWMWHNLRFHAFLKLLRTDAIRLDISTVMDKKAAAVKHYLSKEVSGCNKPYCGNLPEGFVEYFQYPYEIFFKTF